MDENEKILKQKLNISEKKPLVKTPNEKTAESTDVSKIIKPLEQIVENGKPIKNNKIVTDSDKITTQELLEILSTPIPKKNIPNVPSTDGLSEAQSKKIKQEESKRRRIESERRTDVQQAYMGEIQRRKNFNDKIQLMKDEFNLYCKKNYPNIVGERAIINGDESILKKSIDDRNYNLNKSNDDIQKNKVDRLEREKLRKQSESELELNKLTPSEVQIFFENEILLEQKVKLRNNPEIENLNYVKQTQREINELELSMGRRIVWHRDVVESEESDFDVNALTNSDDILVLTERDKLTPNEIQKQEYLQQLRMRLMGDDTEEIYILKN